MGSLKAARLMRPEMIEMQRLKAAKLQAIRDIRPPSEIYAIDRRMDELVHELLTTEDEEG